MPPVDETIAHMQSKVYFAVCLPLWHNEQKS